MNSPRTLFAVVTLTILLCAFGAQAQGLAPYPEPGPNTGRSDADDTAKSMIEIAWEFRLTAAAHSAVGDTYYSYYGDYFLALAYAASVLANEYDRSSNEAAAVAHARTAAAYSYWAVFAYYLGSLEEPNGIASEQWYYAAYASFHASLSLCQRAGITWAQTQP